MKTSIFNKILLLTFLMMSLSINAQLWTPISANKTQSKAKELRKNMPSQYQLFSLNTKQLTTLLKNTPNRILQKSSNIIVKLPTYKGELKNFRILEAPLFSDGLAKKFPNIRSFIGYGIDDPTSIARFSLSSIGLHAMITSGNHGAIFIDPYTKDKNDYIVYSKTDISNSQDSFECLVKENFKSDFSEKQFNTVKNANDGKLRTFRLALACTGEYAQFHLNNQGVSSGASDQIKKAAILAAMNTTMTRVNGVFEKDLAVTMVLVSNNDDLIFLNSQTDSYTNNNGGTMLSQNQQVCDRTIGSANYDIGHVFSTGGGGVAYLNSPCGSLKAGGVTGGSRPIGDPFDIDFVAHEMGHQYGGNHTQNNNCQRSNASVEPGSASTIMGYAGICTPNVQNNSDSYFHAISIQEMWLNITQGSSRCASQSNTGNAAPTADAGQDYTIPVSTPFILKGNGSDSNSSNSLTYCWEQMDAQPATMPPSSTSNRGPAFRSLNPSSSSDRYMPALPTVIAGQTSSTWEVVPSVSRTMNFRLTVRDNASGGGGTASDNTRITVTANAGPFVVNAPNTNVSWASGSQQTVTWDVAGTTGNGVNAANVDILLSTDGGNTYPVTIATAVANDGSQNITVPNAVGIQNRIMVRGSGNIFYDISNTNFEITTGGGGSDNEAPTAPTSLVTSNITQTTVDLNWTAATDNVGVVGYDVYQENSVIATVTGTTYQVTGLSANTAYSFTVRAKDAAGNESTSSNTANATTLEQPDNQTPTAPTSLVASNITQTTVDLNWTAATDNVGVVGYDVYQGNSVIATVTGTTYQVTGLSANTAYSFTVIAKDAAGNESTNSNTANATTLTSGGDGNTCTGGISSFPYTESFENTLGTWTQSTGDDFNWTVDENGTPSRNTGPSSAAQGTYYVYMESSSPNFPAKRAILNSPCFDLSAATGANFTFQYHMYGAAGMGSLALEASNDNGATWSVIWSKSGNQGNTWQSANIDLATYVGASVQLRYNGITGNTWQGDMAIDNIRLTEAGGPSTCTDVSLTLNFDNYPEETSWQITNNTNQVIASGGTYGSQPDGSTLSITECLEPGTYTFTLNDSFGDGMCCRYGNGSYTLTSQGATIASGGTFGTSESTEFTVNAAARGVVFESKTSTNPMEISGYPNPVGKNRIITVTATKKNTNYQVVNLLGKIVLQGKLIEKSIHTDGLPAGMYVLKLNHGGKAVIIPFVQE